MSAFNTFGENLIQMKVGERAFHCHKIGDRVDIPDGIYFGFGGIVVIRGGEFIAEFKNNEIFNKWGGPVVIDIYRLSKIQSPSLDEEIIEGLTKLVKVMEERLEAGEPVNPPRPITIDALKNIIVMLNAALEEDKKEREQNV